MSVPPAARSTSADSSSTACTRRASLPCSSASAARALARLDLLQAAQRGPRPSRRPCARPPATSPAREVAGRRRRDQRRRGRRRAGSPGAARARLTLNELRPRPAHGAPAPARSSWRRAPRVDGAWPRRCSSSADQRRRGRRACPRRARARPPRSTRSGTPRRLGGARRGARGCPGRSSARSRPAA